MRASHASLSVRVRTLEEQAQKHDSEHVIVGACWHNRVAVQHTDNYMPDRLGPSAYQGGKSRATG